MPEQAKLHVAAYACVSSDSADQLDSYIAQVDFYTRHIGKDPDWELVDIYANEGITDTSTQRRDEFSRMMTDCRAGKIDRILVKSVSRFARNTGDTLRFMRKLLKLGATIQFEKEDIATGKLSTEQGISSPASMPCAYITSWSSTDRKSSSSCWPTSGTCGNRSSVPTKSWPISTRG